MRKKDKTFTMRMPSDVHYFLELYANQNYKPSWNKGLKMEKIECPYCGKFIDKLNAKKWHFDNCKMKK